MRKKWISFLGVVCVLCLHAIPSSAEQLTLSELYQMADSQSLVIRVAESELVAANHGVQQAKNALLPSLSADISGSYIGDAYLLTRGFSASGTTDVILAGLGPQSIDNGRQPTPHWGNNFSFQASQVIYAGGAILAGIEMAKAGERIAQLQVDKSRQEVRLMLTGYYLDLVKLQNQLHVLDTHIALTEEVLTMMRARHEAGTILSSDLTRYELQLKQLQLSRVRLLDAQSIIQHQLQTTLHTDRMLVPDTVFLQQEYGRLEQSVAETYWQQQAANSNLDLKQADAAGEIAAQQVKAVRSASIPKIALIIRDELWGPYTNDLIPTNANVNAWFVGIGLHYDIDELWHNHRAIKRAKTEQQVAQDKAALAREAVDNQVHAAYTAFLTSFTEVDTQLKQQQLADETYDLVEKRYENDLALLTDLLDASSTKLTADLALVNARIGLIYNYYQLKYITHSL